MNETEQFRQNGEQNPGCPPQDGFQQQNQQGGYQQPGYQQGNYQQPGYQQGGYQQCYQQPGYQQGGYQQGYPQGYQEVYPQGAPPRPYVETTHDNPFNPGPEGKSRGVFALLALLTGSIGLQYFYIGKIGGGILTIVLVCITCGLWALLPIIQGIIMFWNMTNEEFDRKFIVSDNFFPIL